MTENIDNPQLQLAFDFVQQTNTNIFLTGKAGTGKTTFLRTLKTRSPKRMIVVAPTGVAAINAGGVTIHSFFQLHFGPHLPVDSNTEATNKDPENQKNLRDSEHRFGREKINIIRSLDLLIIDEISMVRADLLDGIDNVLRRYKDKQKPFGGVQLLMIGDLQQLAPVAKDDEWGLLKTYYDTPFFFGSRALQKTHFTTIELKHIYRQSDQVFIDLLNKVRNNKLDQQTLDILNSRFDPGFAEQDNEGYITLTTHNYQSQAINETKLDRILSQVHEFKAEIEGDFPEYGYPTDAELSLKTGAQVMFVKNDISREKLFYNGKIGVITEIEEDVVYVKCEGDYSEIPVTPAEWTNNRYNLNPETKEITETPVGKFIQYPLKLAWAITIHKSQGLTFEKAIIDAKSAFAHGQVYVALSRCKTFEGLVLTSRISSESIKNDSAVRGFTLNAELNQPDEKELLAAKIAYQHTLLAEMFDFANLQSRLSYCLKLTKEYDAVFLPSVVDSLNLMQGMVMTEIFEISERFKSQMAQYLQGQPVAEENLPLQERIKKACSYFSEKIGSHVFIILDHIQLESDNRAVRTLLLEAYENLYLEAFIKNECFKACREGFFVKIYLETNAKSSIEKVRLRMDKRSPIPGSPASFAGVDSILYNLLKAWRNQVAEDLNLPEYMVIPQRTLVQITREQPLLVNDLKKIKGLGKRKIKLFGKDILSVIHAFLELDGVVITAEEENDFGHTEKQKPVKGQSAKLSLELFEAGKSISEIARERQMTLSTIGGHLAKFVASGDLEIRRLVPQEKIDLVKTYYEKTETSTFSETMAVLGDKITYAELRMIHYYLFSGNMEPGI